MGGHHSKKHHSTLASLARRAQEVPRVSRREPAPILQEGMRIELTAPDTESTEEAGLMKHAESEELPSSVQLAKEESHRVCLATRIAPGSGRLSSTDGIEVLCEQSQADAELSQLFPPDRYGTYEMGDIDDFVGGLNALVGAPNPDLMTTMRDEHTMRYDSCGEFSHAPYWIKTTSEIEWYFVTDPEGGPAKLSLSQWPAEGEDAVEKCTVSNRLHALEPGDKRKPLPLSYFRDKLNRHNQVLYKYAVSAPLPRPLNCNARIHAGICTQFFSQGAFRIFTEQVDRKK